mmetsp:Transcript_2939/g.6721  ORF Transcript_2939/g.6721 Transcript_2939/m.6721 type:complete len:462 (+) Transcript_2939:642-2027(+)
MLTLHQQSDSLLAQEYRHQNHEGHDASRHPQVVQDVVRHRPRGPSVRRRAQQHAEHGGGGEQARGHPAQRAGVRVRVFLHSAPPVGEDHPPALRTRQAPLAHDTLELAGGEQQLHVQDVREQQSEREVVAGRIGIREEEERGDLERGPRAVLEPTEELRLQQNVAPAEELADGGEEPERAQVEGTVLRDRVEGQAEGVGLQLVESELAQGRQHPREDGAFPEGGADLAGRHVAGRVFQADDGVRAHQQRADHDRESRLLVVLLHRRGREGNGGDNALKSEQLGEVEVEVQAGKQRVDAQIEPQERQHVVQVGRPRGALLLLLAQQRGSCGREQPAHPFPAVEPVQQAQTQQRHAGPVDPAGTALLQVAVHLPYQRLHRLLRLARQHKRRLAQGRGSGREELPRGDLLRRLDSGRWCRREFLLGGGRAPAATAVVLVGRSRGRLVQKRGKLLHAVTAQADCH